MSHCVQTLYSAVHPTFLLGDLWIHVWACYVVCIPSCAQFTEDVCIWDAFAWEPGVLAGRTHTFVLWRSVFQSSVDPKCLMMVHLELWGLLQMSSEVQGKGEQEADLQMPQRAQQPCCRNWFCAESSFKKSKINFFLYFLFISRKLERCADFKSL